MEKGVPARAQLPTDPTLLPPTERETLDALTPLLATAGLPALDAVATRAITAHLRLLDAWNPAINLTRIVAPTERAERHLLDALVAAPLIEGLLGADARGAEIGRAHV